MSGDLLLEEAARVRVTLLGDKSSLPSLVDLKNLSSRGDFIGELVKDRLLVSLRFGILKSLLGERYESQLLENIDRNGPQQDAAIEMYSARCLK